MGSNPIRTVSLKQCNAMTLTYTISGPTYTRSDLTVVYRLSSLAKEEISLRRFWDSVEVVVCTEAAAILQTFLLA